MFELQVKELYKYLTKKELVDTFSIIRQERKSMIQYVTDEYKWILVPKKSDMTEENYQTRYKINNSSNL